MNSSIKLGEVNRLRIDRVTEYGLFLMSEDETSVLLPNVYVKQEMQIDSLIDVFIYTDSEDRLVATTLKPYIKKDEIAFLEIVDIAKFGAFVDIGLAKDILVPKNEQKSSYKVGTRKVLMLIEDERTNRLIATEKFSKYQKDDVKKFSKNDEVKIIVYSKTPLGFKVIVNDAYEAMIFHTEVFEAINIGDIKKAYIKNVRDDGKLDVSLQKIGQKRGDDNPNKVLEILKQEGGALPFTYKSDSEEIKEQFSMSKKAFKASLTKLINDKKINLTDKEIILNSN